MEGTPQSTIDCRKEKFIFAHSYINKSASEETTSFEESNKNSALKGVEDPDFKFDTAETRFLEISKDKLSAKFIGKGTHPHDIGTIRTNKPLTIPSDSCVAYFEITLVNSGTKP